jgi:hypothetical protein
MKTHKIIILFIGILTLGQACDTFTWDGCYEEKPTEGVLNIKVTINETVKSVPVTIYLGKVEANQIFLRDTLFRDTASYIVPVNTYYSAAAQYQKDEETIIAIMGGEVRTVLSSDDESTDCWELKNLTLNLRLK